MKKAKGENEAMRQIDKFKAAAKELGCEEGEGRYDGLLKKVAEQKPTPRKEPKKKE
jgi:hypothetical protein